MIGTGAVAGLALVFTFHPGIQAAGQYVLRDSDEFSAYDAASLTEHGVGRDLKALGLTPQTKFTDTGGQEVVEAAWVKCTTPENDDECMTEVFRGTNRIILTTYSRDWRGGISDVQLSRVAWLDRRHDEGGLHLDLEYCTVVYGATAPDLFIEPLPNVKYCK